MQMNIRRIAKLSPVIKRSIMKRIGVNTQAVPLHQATRDLPVGPQTGEISLTSMMDVRVCSHGKSCSFPSNPHPTVDTTQIVKNCQEADSRWKLCRIVWTWISPIECK